jgi:anti-sigma factor RsiW
MRLLRRKPNPISCQELVELVTDYLDGRLPDADQRRFEGHIGDCEHCAAYLEQIRATVAVAGTLSEETLPPGAADALLAEFRDWKLARG